MADTKISAMTNPSYLDGTERFAGVTTAPGQIAADIYKINAGALVYLNAAYTLTSTTSAQKLFNTTTNGTLTIGQLGLYEFEGIISVTGMSATSGNLAFNLAGAGSATVSGTQMYISGLDASTLNSAASLSGQVVAASNTVTAPVVVAATGTGVGFYLSGLFKVTATGTLIPSISLGAAAAAVVGAGSWLRIKMLAPNAVYSVGNWS